MTRTCSRPRAIAGAFLVGALIPAPSAGDAPAPPEREWNLPDPGMGIRGLAPALDGTLLFVVIKPDTTVKQPRWSSSMAAVSILRSFDPATGNVTTLDPNFVPTDQVITDPAGVAWMLDSKHLWRRSGGRPEPVAEVSAGTGQFRAMTADPAGGVWLGGLKTGLYHVDSELQVTHYTRENSFLPTNSLTAVHVDDAGRVWVALWDLKGVLCIDGPTWTIHDSSNSGISRQNIWSIASDQHGDIWIGQGWDDPLRMLTCFDGESWTPQSVRDESGEIIRGTVRRLTRVGDRLWVWIDGRGRPGGRTRGGHLLVREGGAWKPVAGTGDRQWVEAVSVDPRHRRAWVLVADWTEHQARLLEFPY